jgi:catalase
MVETAKQSRPFAFRACTTIAVVVGMVALAFAYTAGWLSARRLTPEKLIAALQSESGPPLGHRRNHSKGICFTGILEANGRGTALSTASVFAPGVYPVVGRFNIGGTDPNQPDPLAQVRGFGIRITTPDGQEWRSAMIDAPVFAAPTAQAFYEFLTAARNNDPNALKKYSAVHPEILAFVSWVKNHLRTESWTEDRFNSLDSFIFIDATETKHAVRWSFVPETPPVTLTPSELAKREPNFLMEDIAARVAAHPQHWELMITVASPGDPTADPTKSWPEDRQTINVGTLTVQDVQQEADGPCRDINYDPVVLPSGITTSDDPIPAARSAAYAFSYDSRTSEASHYPRVTRAKQ